MLPPGPICCPFRLPHEAIFEAAPRSTDAAHQHSRTIDTPADKLARMLEAMMCGQAVSYEDMLEAHAALSAGNSIHQPLNLR